MRTSSWFVLLGTLVVLAISVGCDSFHAARLSNRGSMLRLRMESAESLRRWETSRIASLVLVEALADSEAAIRYAATAALEQHLVANHALDQVELKKALVGLVDLLNDEERVVHFAASPYYSLKRPPRRTGFVRQRALLTLSAATGEDHGYDVDAWRREIASMADD